MKKEKKIQVKIRKPVPKKAETIIHSKKDKLKSKRIKSGELIKQLYEFHRRGSD
ncbi:MAG TPA: hypothetical protein VLB01_00630 [Thermodesulfobacteriota bacterium]|nr:hypothetical protein [Thermodesulfobacteriota bacterium]